MATKPLIVIIDLDGTVLGDIKPQIMLYEILTELKRNGAKVKIHSSELVSKLKKSIIRPYFSEFCKKVTSLYPNIELFIYTASEHSWAHYIVKHIEKAINVTFNRPIFTRSDCKLVDNDYQKCILRIAPKIQRALKAKWGRFEVENNVMIIDNSQVYHRSRTPNLILCPTYDYKYSENIPAYIGHDMFNLHWKTVFMVLKKYINVSSQPTNNYFEFQYNFYQFYISYIKTHHKMNSKYQSDKFWLYLLKILTKKHLNKFSPEKIRYISDKLHYRLNKPNISPPNYGIEFSMK